MYVDANKSVDSKFKAYPDVEASYNLTDSAILHAGVRGGLQQNTVEKTHQKPIRISHLCKKSNLPMYK